MNVVPNSIASSSSDKEMLLTLLRESQDCFLASFAGVTDDQCRCRPAEGSWSVLDTVEHLTFAETAMLHLITKTRCPRTPNSPNREEVFRHAVANRSRKLEAPEMALPCGRFASLTEAAAQFKASREGVIQFVEQCSEDLRLTEVRHPHPVVGVVSTFEMVIIIAKHAERHALQIEEIKSSPAYRAHAKAAS